MAHMHTANTATPAYNDYSGSAGAYNTNDTNTFGRGVAPSTTTNAAYPPTTGQHGRTSTDAAHSAGTMHVQNNTASVPASVPASPTLYGGRGADESYNYNAPTVPTTSYYGRGVAASRWLKTILGLLFVTSVIELGLTAYLRHASSSDVNSVPNNSGIKRRYNYAIFVSIFSLLGSLVLFVLYLVRRTKSSPNSAHATNANAKSDSGHHIGTKVFLILNFILWTVAGALIEARLGNNGSKRVRASSAFAWIPAVLSLVGIPLAFHLFRRSKHLQSLPAGVARNGVKAHA